MSRTLQVLIVEDNPADVDLIREMLPEAGPVLFELDSVSRLSDALGRVRDKTFDLVLLDLGLPDSQGLRTFEKMKEAAPDVPTVVLTGNDDQEAAVAAVKAGAQDYLVKGQVGGSLLARALLYAVERKRTEDALRASETRYRRLFESAKDGILILDAETGVIVDANPFLVEMLALPRETLVGQKIWELRLLGDALANQEKLTALQRERYVRYDDLPLQTADGRVLAVEFLSNVYVVNGQKVIQCNIRDITERKRAEEALRQSEERFRILFEQAADSTLLLEIGPDGIPVIRDANSATFRVLGYERNELIGQPVSLIGVASDASSVVHERRRNVLSGTGTVFEARHRCKDGTIRDFECSGTEMQIGSKTFAISVERDITERIRLQASLAQSDRLANMGMLAAGVAHEINNPLSYVLYNVESLAQDLPRLVGAAKRCCAAVQDKLGSEALAEIAGDGAEMLQPVLLQDVVDRAREALAGARRIKEISRGLGTFSRVERVEQSSVDLKYAIECAVSMAQNEIKYRATLVKDYGQVPAVLGSEGKLSQVFLNLLINAAHATDEGQIEANRIGIRTWTEGGGVFAEVTDTGKGIPKENLERIFEPFFTTKPVGVGSGLGLAICRNIVTELGGDLSVESEVGKGSRFVVRLPVPRDVPEQRPGKALSGKPLPSTVRGRVLVVDDEDDIRRMMKRMLGRDHEVVALASGEETQALLDKDRSFDVILCDLMMPRMSGMELHEWLAAREPVLARRMVFLTGGAFTPKASAYLANIENLRMEKPVDTVALKNLVIERILENRESRDGG